MAGRLDPLDLEDFDPLRDPMFRVPVRRTMAEIAAADNAARLFVQLDGDNPTARVVPPVGFEPDMSFNITPTLMRPRSPRRRDLNFSGVREIRDWMDTSVGSNTHEIDSMRAELAELRSEKEKFSGLCPEFREYAAEGE